MKIGEQYDKDDTFKKEARLYQSKYRANILKAEYKDYGNRLIDGDAYLNYFSKLNVLDDKRIRYPNYSASRDADMLRSEHIPFNIFSPLKLNLDLAKKTFNNILGEIISEVTKIKIEYTPKPKGKYLNDQTSFDTYIEFKHIDNSKGAIGIEVKYTEQAYALGKTEKKAIDKLDSLYYVVSQKSELYVENATELLKKDDFRQIWRNQLLGETIKLNKEISHFISMTLYPSGNTHFSSVIPKYFDLLKPDKKNSFIAVTFEELFDIYSKFSSISEYNEWIEFLKKRYIISNYF